MRRTAQWLVVLVICAATHVMAGAAPPAAAASPAAWTVIDSANFRLYGLVDRPALDRLAATCEATREALGAKWLGKAWQGKGRPASWEVKCTIILHPTADSYLREVGQGQMTAGSSLIEFGADRLVTRRIDLRADHPQGYADALAHELTHVVLAERFIERQIPRWADEGMAVLADGSAKQELHLADLKQARSQQRMFRVVELVNLEQYPGLDRQGTFYGQSASLAKFLVERGGPQRFVDFVAQATREGYEIALRRTYGIETLTQLEQQWLAELDRPAVARQAQPAATNDRSLALQSK